LVLAQELPQVLQTDPLLGLGAEQVEHDALEDLGVLLLLQPLDGVGGVSLLGEGPGGVVVEVGQV